MPLGRAMLLLDMATIAWLWPLTLALALAQAPALWPAESGLRTVLCPVAGIACLYALGLYRRDVLAATGASFGRMPLVAMIAALGAALAWRLLQPLLGAASTAPPLLAGAGCILASGLFARAIFHGLRRAGVFGCRLLVVGAGAKAWDLTYVLRREGRHLHYDITFVADPQTGPVDPRLAGGALGRLRQAAHTDLPALARRAGADCIVVAPDERRGMDLRPLLACKVAGFPVRDYLGFVEDEIRRVDLKRMELGWLLYADGFRFGLPDRLAKRALDVLVSVPLLLLFAPLLLAAMAAIVIDDGGPVFYRQQRVTRGGRCFVIRKLRTMRPDAECQGAVWAASGDARVTRVGRFLRRSRIDEIPQLFNVLRGDMSLVGPRPERPEFVARLAEAIPLYHERHMVKAGLTGWAQVNYPYGASIDDARSKLSYDLYYVKNFSVLFDLLIVLQTFRVVLWPGGAR